MVVERRKKTRNRTFNSHSNIYIFTIGLSEHLCGGRYIVTKWNNLVHNSFSIVIKSQNCNTKVNANSNNNNTNVSHATKCLWRFSAVNRSGRLFAISQWPYYHKWSVNTFTSSEPISESQANPIRTKHQHTGKMPGLKKHNKNEKCSNRNNVYLWDILLIYNRSTLVYGSMIFGIIFILFFSLLISSTDKHDRGKIVGCMQSNAYNIHFDPWLLIVLSRFLFLRLHFASCSKKVLLSDFFGRFSGSFDQRMKRFKILKKHINFKHTHKTIEI